jgi:hypothetical protein
MIGAPDQKSVLSANQTSASRVPTHGIMVAADIRKKSILLEFERVKEPLGLLSGRRPVEM